MTVEYVRARISLELHLAACLVEACRDLPDERAGRLHERFVGWTDGGRG